MHRIWRCRPSPAMIVAWIALMVSLGGTSYAAIVLPANSVGTKQIKDRAVTNAKIASDAVTAAKVKNGSLVVADISPTSLSTLSRVATATNTADVSGSGGTVASVRLQVPKTGFVLVQGWVTASNANGTYYVRVWDDLTGASSDFYNGCTASGLYSSVGNTAVFPVIAGERDFSVRVEFSNAGTFTAHGTITAQYIPFGATGSRTVLGDAAPAQQLQAMPER
jgi:hypothetical protein